MVKKFAHRIMQFIRQHGIREMLLRLIRRALSVPVATMIICLWPIYRIRLILLKSSRIGHYALNTHLLLNALKYNAFPEEQKVHHWFYTQTHVPVSNVFLNTLFSRVITLLSSWGAFWSHVDSILKTVLKDRYFTAFKQTFENTEGGYDKWFFQKKHNQFFSFTENEKKQGEQLKQAMGIPANKPHVCILVRDSAYLKKQFPNSAWYLENFRDAHIENFIPAIHYLIEQGFYVVRMGKEVENAFTIDHPAFIDYASHALKSDFMDIYLSATCSFFLGTCCGLDAIPRMFNRPVVATNAILFNERSYLDWTLMIPKNILCTTTNEFIPYREIYADYQHFLLSGLYDNHRDPILTAWKEKNWALTENTPDELLMVTTEMVSLLRGSYIETDNMKEMQRHFWRQFPLALPESEKNYDNLIMRISPGFLEKHANLIAEATVVE